MYLDFLDRSVQLESFQNAIEALERLRVTPDEMVTAYSQTLKKTASPTALFNSIEALGDSDSHKAIDALLAVKSALSSDPIANQLLQDALSKLRGD